LKIEKGICGVLVGNFRMTRVTVRFVALETQPEGSRSASEAQPPVETAKTVYALKGGGELRRTCRCAIEDGRDSVPELRLPTSYRT
jgi:hypothetical protein